MPENGNTPTAKTLAAKTSAATSSEPTSSTPTKVVVVCAIVLAILHQDIWFWDNKTLLFGFLPIGLGYHALYSVMASALWAAAVIWAWPAHIEQWADEGSSDDSSGASSSKKGGQC
jgi:hypothetical protein